MSTRKEPDKRIQRYLEWYYKRLEGQPEDQILRELEAHGLGEFGSPEILYQKLAADGFPVCRVCGATPVPSDHCGKPEEKRKRQARRAGKRLELPPPRAASSIFRAVLVALGDDIDKLADRREWLQGERFVAGDYPNARVVMRLVDPPSDPPEETVLQEHGEVAIPRGAGQAPAEPLTTLIAVAALAGYQLPALLKKLHPDPNSIDNERLEQAVRELRNKARQLARLVRGGNIRRGPSTEELSLLEQFAAWEIYGMTQAGRTETEIEDWVGYLKAAGFGKETISRLRSLRLDPDVRQ
jgi:hypothetical protein